MAQSPSSVRLAPMAEKRIAQPKHRRRRDGEDTEAAKPIDADRPESGTSSDAPALAIVSDPSRKGDDAVDTGIQIRSPRPKDLPKDPPPRRQPKVYAEEAEPKVACEKCGEIHPKCRAHNTRGKPCGRDAMNGQNVCYMHGGAAAQNRKAGARRQAQEKLTTASRTAMERLKLLGEPLPDVDPLEGLLEAVNVCAFWVAILRAECSTIEKLYGPNHLSDATPHVAIEMLRSWTAELARVCKDAIQAGIQERMIRLAEAQAALLIQVLEGVRDDMALTGPQRKAWPGVVRHHLTAVSGGRKSA